MSSTPPWPTATTGVAAGERLDRGDAEVLDSRLEIAERGARARGAPALDTGRRSGRRLRSPGERLEPSPLRAVADDDQGNLRPGAGSDRGVHFLYGARAATMRINAERGRRRGPEVVDVDRRRDHLGVAAVVAPDAVGARRGSWRDRGRRGSRSRRPSAAAGRGAARGASRQGRSRSGSRLAAGPRRSASGCGSSRRVTPSSRGRPLGDAVAGRDQELVPPRVELLDGDREERQVAAVAALEERRTLQEAGVDRMLLELGVDRAGKVEERVDRRPRREPGELVEHLLAAALPGEPVVNETDRAVHAAPSDRTAR